jgi:hypothetical protein
MTHECPYCLTVYTSTAAYERHVISCGDDVITFEKYRPRRFDDYDE